MSEFINHLQDPKVEGFFSFMYKDSGDNVTIGMGGGLTLHQDFAREVEVRGSLGVARRRHRPRVTGGQNIVVDTVSFEKGRPDDRRPILGSADETRNPFPPSYAGTGPPGIFDDLVAGVGTSPYLAGVLQVWGVRKFGDQIALNELAGKLPEDHRREAQDRRPVAPEGGNLGSSSSIHQAWNGPS